MEDEDDRYCIIFAANLSQNDLIHPGVQRFLKSCCLLLLVSDTKSISLEINKNLKKKYYHLCCSNFANKIKLND